MSAQRQRRACVCSHFYRTTTASSCTRAARSPNTRSLNKATSINLSHFDSHVSEAVFERQCKQPFVGPCHHIVTQYIQELASWTSSVPRAVQNSSMLEAKSFTSQGAHICACNDSLDQYEVDDGAEVVSVHYFRRLAKYATGTFFITSPGPAFNTILTSGPHANNCQRAWIHPPCFLQWFLFTTTSCSVDTLLALLLYLTPKHIFNALLSAGGEPGPGSACSYITIISVAWRSKSETKCLASYSTRQGQANQYGVALSAAPQEDVNLFYFKIPFSQVDTFAGDPNFSLHDES